METEIPQSRPCQEPIRGQLVQKAADKIYCMIPEAGKQSLEWVVLEEERLFLMCLVELSLKSGNLNQDRLWIYNNCEDLLYGTSCLIKANKDRVRGYKSQRELLLLQLSGLSTEEALTACKLAQSMQRDNQSSKGGER